MIDTLWGTRPRRAITVAASILLAITAIGLFTDPDPDLPVGDMPTLPDQHETSTPDKPFWASTFTVRLPAGYWAPIGDGECTPIGGSDGVQFETGAGVPVELYDRGPVVALDSLNDLDGDTCLVDGVVFADYTTIADTYILHIGGLTATFTNVGLYQGQGRGQNAVVPAGAVT